MAEVKWIKITTTMFDDEKIRLIESMPEADTLLIIWIKLLVLAGKTNANGYIYLSENIPYTDEMLATLFNRPLNVVRMALKTFEQFGMITADDTGIYIDNWEKHQNVQGLEKIREQNRLRKQKQREREKALMAPLKEELGVTEESHVMSRDNHATEEEREEEEDIDKEKEEEKEENSCNRLKIIALEYEKAGFGTINYTIKEILEDLIEQYSDEWITQAFKECVKRNKRSLSYASGILENWRREGGMKIDEGDSSGKHKKHYTDGKNFGF